MSDNRIVLFKSSDDVVISVGYRVHSLRGVEFRCWATSILKEYIVQGEPVNFMSSMNARHSA